MDVCAGKLMKINEELKKLPTPAVVIELETAEENIRKMVETAHEYGLKHRPHVKTHRSGFFAEMQMKAGCDGITVAKLGEGEVMADCGIKDIFVAYPIIGQDKLDRLCRLSERASVSTMINSYEGAYAMSRWFESRGKRIDVLIEIDGGLNRGGVKPEAALDFARQVEHLSGIRITGLMYYGGLIYNARNLDELDEYTRREHDELVETAKILEDAGFCMEVLSAGSSFSGKRPWLLQGITEIRSGHYIFNDCGQLDLGLASPEECALFVVTTVVAKPDDHVVICDAGTKSLTSDSCHYRKGYGYIQDYPELEVYALNEEHAFVRSEERNPLKIGDKITIIPNHACVVTNLAGCVYGFRDGKFCRMIQIDAQSKSV